MLEVCPIMKFGLLGPLYVHEEHGTIPIPSARQRTILAALLTNANEPLTQDVIIEILWDGASPQHARTALRTYVMRLRQALGPLLSQRIVTRAQSYLIEVDDAEVDLLRFTSLYQSARTAIRSADWRQAAVDLQSALALWRGEPLVDVPSQLLRERELPRIEQMLLQALEWHYETQLTLGRHQDIILDLKRSVAEHPLREKFRAQLMLALYYSGQRADSLAAFQETRRYFVDELGVEPGPELQQLHQAVLTDTVRALEPLAEADTAPRGVVTSFVPRQLPAPPHHFVGRQAEQDALNQALAGVKNEGQTGVTIVSITGFGGVGKTALALHWAHQVAELFPDGQLFVNLRGFDATVPPLSPAAAVRGFLEAYAVPEERIPADLDAQCNLFRSLMAGKHVLIVLDNAKDAQQVRPLLPGSATCMVLVTSRNQLTGLLAEGGGTSLHLDTLCADETRALLERFLSRERLSAEPDATDKLIELCGRIPLTTRIVAAEALAQPGVSISGLMGYFSEMPSQLDRFETDDPVTSMRSILTGSYRHLDESSAHLFRYLGLYHGSPITPLAAASLAGVTLSNARRAFIELTRHNLLTLESPGQFEMHDIIRSYAAERVCAEESEADRRTAMNRLFDYYLYSADNAASIIDLQRKFSPLPHRPRMLSETFASTSHARAWLETHLGSMLTALNHARDIGYGAFTWLLTERISGFLQRLGRWHEWANAAECAAAVARELGDPLGEALGELELGHATSLLHPDDKALAHLTRALDLFQRHGAETDQARAHLCMSQFFGWRLREREFREHAQRALEIYRKIEFQNGLAEALNSLGWFCIGFGDNQTAVTSCKEALVLYQELGNRPGEADVWDSLAHAYEQSGDLSMARACYSQSIALDEQLDRLGNRFNQADTLNRFGDLEHAAGDQEAAVAAWSKALRILDEIDHPKAAEVRQKISGLLATPHADT